MEVKPEPASKRGDNIERRGKKKVGMKLLNGRISSAGLELFSASYHGRETVLTFRSAGASRARHKSSQRKVFQFANEQQAGGKKKKGDRIWFYALYSSFGESKKKKKIPLQCAKEKTCTSAEAVAEAEAALSRQLSPPMAPFQVSATSQR